MPRAKGVKQVAANRKALHDYFVLERFEAGVDGVLELGRQICRAEMPAKRRLRVLENVRNVQRSNGTV